MADQFGGCIDIDALFPAHGNIVMAHAMRRDDCPVFGSDIRCAIAAGSIWNTGGHTAAYHELGPQAFGSGFRKVGFIDGALEQELIRGFAQREEYAAQFIGDGNEAIGIFILERTDLAGAFDFPIDIALDVHQVALPVEVTPLQAVDFSGTCSEVIHTGDVCTILMPAGDDADAPAFFGSERAAFTGISGCGLFHMVHGVAGDDFILACGFKDFIQGSKDIGDLGLGAAGELIHKGLQFARLYGAHIAVAEHGKDILIEGIAVGIHGAYAAFFLFNEGFQPCEPILGACAEEAVLRSGFTLDVIFDGAAAHILQFAFGFAGDVFIDIMPFLRNTDFHPCPVKPGLLLLWHKNPPFVLVKQRGDVL